MDVFHRRAPAELFNSMEAAAAAAAAKPGAQRGAVRGDVTFRAFELVGKRCFDLADDHQADSGEAAGNAGVVAAAAAVDGGRVQTGAAPALEPGAATVEGTRERVSGKREVFLRVGEDGATHVCGASEHAVPTAEELLRRLQRAVARRETSATAANATSSRSHAVYALALPGGGRLKMIDLAGSEGRLETLFHSTQHMAEAREINNSLSVLRACLRARFTAAAHVPFRESTLTRVLKGALTDPDAATALLACVSPACSHLEHSLRTLRTAVQLTGHAADETEAEVEVVEEEVLSEQAVRGGGPKRWDAAALSAWLAERPFGARVQLPAAMSGAQLMRLPRGRLRPLCGGDGALARRRSSWPWRAALPVSVSRPGSQRGCVAHAPLRSFALTSISHAGQGVVRRPPSRLQAGGGGGPRDAAEAQAEGIHGRRRWRGAGRAQPATGRWREWHGGRRSGCRHCTAASAAAAGAEEASGGQAARGRSRGQTSQATTAEVER